MVQQKDEIMVRQREMVRQATQQWKGQVDGKVAVVTGGARGIGRVIVEGLLAAGANVVAADQKWDNAEEFRKHLESTGRGMAVQVDVAEDASLDSAYEAVMERFGTVDALVNNAALVSETLFLSARSCQDARYKG